VSYLVHDQFFYFVPPPQRIKNSLLGRLRATVYILSIKEWNMNTAVSHYLWKPLKSIGRACASLDTFRVQVVSLALFLVAVGVAVSATLSTNSVLALSITAAIISILFYTRAYAMKNSARICWNLIMLGHLFGALFLGLAAAGNRTYFVMYGVGVVGAFIAGHACLWYLQKRGESLALGDYHGSIYAFKELGHVFFIVCLLFMAFPVSPSFLGQDILLSRIPGSHVLQIALFCLGYLIMGVSVMRLFTKVFFGPYKTSYHEIAYKSS
jgi:NADH-quinone oxidoreductase subunit L